MASKKKNKPKSGNSLPANHVRQEVLKKSLTLMQAKAHKGPIPSAETLKEYSQVREDLPNLIIDTWQRETHLREVVVKSHIRQESRKIYILYFYIFGLFGLVIALAWVGKYELAAGIIMSPVLLKMIDSFCNKKN